MPIHTVPIDRLHSEVERLEREGHRIVGVAPDMHKPEWHIVTEAPGDRLETRPAFYRGGQVVGTLIRRVD